MPRTILFAALALAMLSACTPAAESAQQAGVTTRTAMQDNQAAWRDLFTYRPKDTRPQLPQTRYCYQMQADIVCYDSPQSGMTAKMIGYQDGNSISWIQPGGGSLGVSGGEPTAQHHAATVQVAPNVAAPTAQVISTSNTPMAMEPSPAPAMGAPFSPAQSVTLTQ